VNDTPRTDKASWRECQQSMVDADFARELERELARVTAERDEARREVCECKWFEHSFHVLNYARMRGWDCFEKEGKP